MFLFTINFLTYEPRHIRHETLQRFAIYAFWVISSFSHRGGTRKDGADSPEGFQTQRRGAIFRPDIHFNDLGQHETAESRGTGTTLHRGRLSETKAPSEFQAARTMRKGRGDDEEEY